MGNTRLFWRVGLEQELLIYRPVTTNRPKWTKEEIEILLKHYATANQEELLKRLPGREWTAIRLKAMGLKLSRKVTNKKVGRPFTPEEDKAVRQYYAGEIGTQEVLAITTGREIYSIWHRAVKLGLGERKKELLGSG